MTANEDLLDEIVRREIQVRRFSAGETKRLRQTLEALDADLVAKIRDKLNRLKAKQGTDPRARAAIQRLNAFLDDLRAERERIIRTVTQTTETNVTGFARVEADAAQQMVNVSMPVQIEFIALSDNRLRTLILETPFQGHTLKGWFETLLRADQRRLVEQINLGMIQGESVPNIVRRIIGTRAGGYQNGVLSVTRRQAEAIVRTAINHSANTTREMQWATAPPGVINLLMWASTLDGRTTPTCRSRDGQIAPTTGEALPRGYDSSRLLYPVNARPPAHVNCRSVMVPVVDGDQLLGDRPFVTDTRTRRKREIDFRAQAKAEAGPGEWSSLSEQERRARIREKRQAWTRTNIGQTPAKTDYEQFLRRQIKEFQDDVLGKTRAKLYREGGLQVRDFTDRAGQELTLEQLRELKPGAFRAAGL